MAPLLNTTVASLREDVFRSPEGQRSATTPQIVSSPLVGTIPVYTLPSTHEAKKETLYAWHVFLMAAGASSAADRREWQAYTATLTAACLPELKGQLVASPMFEEKVLPETTVASILAWYANVAALNNPKAEAVLVEACEEDIKTMLFPLRLPPPTVSLRGIDILEVTSVESIYGHYSLVLFLAGKTITDANRVAITQKRPGAIERKYFGGRSIASLTGSLALSHAAHEGIHTAFTHLSALRRAVFERVARFGSDQDAAHIEVMATTTRLMRFAGMQQAVIIDAFLSSHEEAFRVPMLAPSIAAYTASLRDLAKVPSELRPYHKLIYGDTTLIFNRNAIQNLLTVALYDARELNPSLQRYNMPANAELVLGKYTQSLQALADAEEE